MTLRDLNSLTLHNLIQLNYQHNNLLQLFLWPQKSTLPVDVTQACPICYHLSFQHKNLPHFFFLIQMHTLPVDIPQSYYLYSHMTSQWWSLSQLHHLHPVTLPVEIPTHSHQKNNQRNSTILYPKKKRVLRFINTIPYGSYF